MLMPKFIAKKHDTILENYIRNCQTFTDNQISSHLQTKQKFIQPVNIFLKLISSMSGDIEMIGMMREIKSRSHLVDHILVDQNDVKN